ncbi:MAG: hypothetical protein R3B59_01260 [Dehalococcoidia bacterium]
MSFRAISIAPAYAPPSPPLAASARPVGRRERMAAWMRFLDSDGSLLDVPGCVECGRRDTAISDFRCRRCAADHDAERREMWASIRARRPKSAAPPRDLSPPRFDPVITAVEFAAKHGGDIWAAAVAIGARVEYGEARSMRGRTSPVDGFSLSDGGPRALIVLADDLRGLDRDCILAHEVAHVVAKQRRQEVTEAACDEFAVAFHVASEALRRGLK